ncbi:MAG: hypothetical protein LQ346_005208 [Caloplaca aetnensis]|nr:MAG: hypothetical protein LQ346_005208 [Caloplaca aetnensis]
MAVSDDFDWRYLLFLLVCGILSIFFLFYFNRVFASLVSYAIRTYFWRQYHVYIDIQALQLSLLGGRCFFSGFRYHGHNETVLINDGYITWRYWLRRVRDTEYSAAARTSSQQGREEEDGEKHSTHPGKGRPGSNLPCRVELKARGIEWFIYNRTPAYEAIEKALSSNGQTGGQLPASRRGNSTSQPQPFETEKPATHPDSSNGELSSSIATDEKRAEKEAGEEGSVHKSFVASMVSLADSATPRTSQQAESLPAYLMSLPLKIECSKGAVVMGNPNTQSVLTAKCDGVTGHVDAHQSRAMDLYKQMFEFNFVHPVITMRPNQGYTNPQTPTKGGPKPKDNKQDDLKTSPRQSNETDGKTAEATASASGKLSGAYRVFAKAMSKSGSRRRKESNEAPNVPGQDQWLGLTRYLGDEDNIALEQERWRSVEYGEHPVIVDSPSIAMRLHWDVPGIVGDPVSEENANVPTHDINGAIPPDWAVELRVNGGLICYGPWADRLRQELQPMFFPSTYQDAIPAKSLLPGQTRTSTVFKLNIDIEQTTTLMIPTREPSKDWKWKDGQGERRKGSKEESAGRRFRKTKVRAKANALPTGRPYGSLDVKLQPDSTITFTMDLVARQSGYRNLLDLDIRAPEMSSSVNHGLLLSAEKASISCDLSNPLGWSATRQWAVNVDCSGLELFLLRDHIFLFTDVINDWTTGPPGDFSTFVPFVYTLNLGFTDFNLHLNANDSNVVNNPASMEENTFVTIWARNLDANVRIPLTSFQPPRNEIPFAVDAQHGGFKLSRPPWNTQHVFVESPDVAAMDDLKIDGSYNYFSDTSPELTDILRMNVHGISPRIRLYGFLIRAFMRLKDNYFGDDIHFRTLEEYQEQVRKTPTSSSHDDPNPQPTKISNDLDVILSITAVTTEASLPSYIYSSEETVVLDIPSLGLDLRFTNYYMDLVVAFSPIAISHASSTSSKGMESVKTSETQVFIDGVEIRGHRLFGLPPIEPTYICNWDFTVGAVLGECSIAFFKAFSTALECFSFTFGDAENALQPLSVTVIHDVTFLRAHIKLLRIWLMMEDAALLATTQDCKIEFNDWSKSFFSQRFCIRLPAIAIAVVDTRSLAFDRTSHNMQLRPHAYLETALDVSMLQRKDDFDSDHQLQQQHLILHDSRTERTPWLLDENQNAALFASSRHPKINAPAMPFPAMPEPLHISVDSTLASASTTNRSLASATSQIRTMDRSSFRSHIRHREPAGVPESAETQRGSGASAKKTRVGSDPAALVDGSYMQPRSLPLEKRRISASTGSMRGTSVRNTIGVSSSYKVAYFRLQHASLDLSEVPVLLGTSGSTSHGYSQHSSNDTTSEGISTEQPRCERLSLIIDLGQGIRGLCKPQCSGILASAFEEFQIREPVSLLDKLHISALSHLPDLERASSTRENISEARVNIPDLRLKLAGEVRGTSDVHVADVSCEISLERCIATFRRWNKASSVLEEHFSSTLSALVSLDQAGLSASVSERDTRQDDANVRLSLKDATIWGCKTAESSGHVQFRDLQVECAINRPDCLPVLIHHVEGLARDAQRFRDIATQQKSRTRHFVLSLAVEGQEMPDPPFLTRASYVLRIANSRIRASDSWRMISRLRYVYHTLPSQSRDRLDSQCFGPSQRCPESAREDVTSIFGRLGMWDSKDVKKSALLDEVFGTGNARTADVPASWAFKMTIRAGAVLVLLQPGKTQSQMHFETVAFDSLVRRKSISTAESASTEMLVSTQLCCSKTSLTLNTSLLELLQNMLILFPTGSYREVPSPPRGASSIAPANTYRMHVVLASEVNTLALDSISFRFLYLCRPLNASVVLAKAPEQRRMSTNFLVHTHLATMELLSNSRIVAVGKIDRPSIFGNLDGETTASAPSSWHLASSSTDVSLKMLEDPLRLFEIMDRVLLNEVAYVDRMISTLRSSAHEGESSPAASTDMTVGKPHMALFLDSYLISYKLLSALSYRITGTTGRISLRPGSRHTSDVILDFDLKGHAHSFLGRVGAEVEMISELVIPPINGRLVLDIGTSRKEVSFQSTVEHIDLDAAAVHALLATLNRSEIAELVSNIQHESSRMTRRYKPVGKTDDAVPASESVSQPILFDASVILVGLGIHTKTTTDANKNIMSQLHFELGHVHVKGNNRGMKDRRSLSYPELFVYLRGLQVGFTRFLEGQDRACGDFNLAMTLRATSQRKERGKLVRAYQLRSSQCETNIYTETAAVMISVLNDLRESFRDIDMSNEVKGLQKLRRATMADLEIKGRSKPGRTDEEQEQSTALFSAVYSLELINPQVAWRIGDSISISPGREAEDLILSFTKIDLATRRDNAARLLIQDFQLQLVPKSRLPTERSLNSALLPEVVFNVAYMSSTGDRRLAFQAAGKSLDLRLTSQFILPASNIRRSIGSALNDIRAAREAVGVPSPQAGNQTQKWLKHKPVTSLLIDADFAGAVVYIQGRSMATSETSALEVLHGKRLPQPGRYGQFTDGNTSSNTTLRAPGVALKVEYKDSGAGNTSLNAEVKVDASSNTLYPSVVPLALEISSSVKEIVGEPDSPSKSTDGRPSVDRGQSASKLIGDERIRAADPSAIFGNSTLNLGLRICKQDFSLSCQPVARVAAKAQIDNIYMTANTVRSKDSGQSFALACSVSGLQASVQHVYSRESTGGLEVQSVIVSLMNSKHLGAPNGIAVITQFSPTKVFLNVKQLQDFLLFREIWVPADIRKPAPAPVPSASSEPQAYVVQRYQQIAAAGAFPWNATLSVAKLDVQVDLGQSLGKSGFVVSDMWVSSKKSSDYEQNLCLGIKQISLESTGRMSGFVTVRGVAVRTTIRWPITENFTAQAPLIQASIGLDAVRTKAAFEFQPFSIADLSGFNFLMYNVRDTRTGHSDRLVGVADISALHAFCTATSASQGLALFQAFERLIQEKQTAYQASLKEIEKFLRRRSTVSPDTIKPTSKNTEDVDGHTAKGLLRLQTKVMVSLGTVNVGIFPGTFSDHQVFSVEALNASAEFAVSLTENKLHSRLSLALGQLQVALSGITKPEGRKPVGEVSVEDVIAAAENARGGTILKVPKVVATMQTWQSPTSSDIEFIFKSSFQGKVDVGWNYSRINFLRDMWNNHMRALAARLGKPLPQSALQITTAMDESGGADGGEVSPGKEKITAVVNMPQSKYQYTAIEPPVIETPQLRDMGEATPPLEWIGLHRERLPNLTHQLVIVSLLEVAREVDDAYSRILGSS